MNLGKREEKPELLPYEPLQKGSLINALTQTVMEEGKILSACIDIFVIGTRRLI